MTDLPTRSANLKFFFTPRGVAVIGASRDPAKLSYGVVKNLTDPQNGFPGPVYPVNPKADEVLGRRCYADISQVPDPVELAVIILPAGMVADAVEACGKRGIKAAVVISGGFREVGAEGLARELKILEVAARYEMRLMGPNGIGVIDTHTPLNTTFAKGMPACGQIAFVSQSGALCGGVIDWIIGRGIGFSKLLSVGNEADVNETDLIPFLALDKVSRVITLYLEDVKGGKDFIPAVQMAAERKPVLVLKTGRTASGQLATASHTGALAGAHTPFRVACRQAGAIEVDSIQTMFNGALALAYQPLLKGDQVAIVTNAGGPAALAADTFDQAGLQLARTSKQIAQVLRGFLVPDAQVAGPVDLLGGAAEDEYRQALETVLADPANDGVLAILVPQVLVNPAAVIRAWQAAIETAGGSKPVVACLMGEASLAEAYQVAHLARIPAYTFPEEAVSALGILRQRARWLERKARGTEDLPTFDPLPGGEVLHTAGSAGRSALDAAEGRTFLEACGVPTPLDFLATTAEEAVDFAGQIGFPVVLKLASPDILHKTDIGGVLLDVKDAGAVCEGFSTITKRAHQAYPQANIRGVQVQKMIRGGNEVIVGVKRDPTYGPLIMFGLGGIYVEVLADVSFRRAPITRVDAEEMIAEVRSARLLKGLRGALPADENALMDVLVTVGQLADAFPEIDELDINPLVVLPAGQGVLAVDVRIILNNLTT